MSWFTSIFRRRKQEQELDAELRFHVEQQVADNIAAGMSSEEARRAARLSFGGLEQIKETCRDERSFVWLEQLGKDIGFVLRSLRRASGFTISVLLALTVGIGAATFFFRVIDRNILFGFPYPHAKQLIHIGYSDKKDSFSPFVPFNAQLRAYLDQSQIFSEFAVAKGTSPLVVIDNEPLPAYVVGISADFFETLGIQPILGRSFLSEEFKPGANSVIISNQYWRQHFQSSPTVLGRTLLIDQQICTIVGVLAADQRLPYYFGRPDLYHPLILGDEARDVVINAMVIGRLKKNTSKEQASAALSTIQLPTLPPWAAAQHAEQTPVLKQLSEVGGSEYNWIELAAGILLYLIACINVMNLMLARLLNRRRELGIRFALGATRGRIVRLLLLENIILTLLACASVLLATRLIFPPLLSAVYDNRSTPYLSFWDQPTLGCIAALSVASIIIITVAPALRLAKAETNSILKDGGLAASESGRLRRLRSSLVMLQAAFAVILLAGSGLMLRTFEKIQQVDLGFDPVGRVQVDVVFPRDYVLNARPRFELFERLKARLNLVPGVKSTSFGQGALLTGPRWGLSPKLETPDGTSPSVEITYAQPELQKTGGLVLKKGRWLSGKNGIKEAVINETMAKIRYGDVDPIGQFFKIKGNERMTYQVVGVVKDVREVMTVPSGPRFYLPAWMNPQGISSLTLQVVPSDWKNESESLIRRAIYEIDPRLIVREVFSMDTRMKILLWEQHQIYIFLRLLSGIALGLVVVGLFSVISYTVNSRMREFGVRLALGAEPKNLHRLVLQHGLITTAIGVVIGIAGALALTRFLQSLLYETTPYDPWVYGGVALILLAATVLACWLPARRAAKADVAQLLRTE